MALQLIASKNSKTNFRQMVMSARNASLDGIKAAEAAIGLKQRTETGEELPVLYSLATEFPSYIL